MKYTVLLAAVAAVVGLSACQKKPADQPPAPEVSQPAPAPAATPPATVQPDGTTKPADTTPPPSSSPPEQR